MRLLGVSSISPVLKETMQAIENYVLSRRNGDGGYTFARLTDSNAQDTYYAMEIFKVIKEVPPNVKKTIAWLYNFPARDIRAHFYKTKALALCNEAPDPKALEAVLSLSSSRGGFGTIDVSVEAPSEFDTNFMAIEILRVFGAVTNNDRHINWLLGFKREDGSFGTKSSNIQSTYHAVSALRTLGFPVRGLTKTVDYVRNCENVEGGFNSSSESKTTYMEDTFHGIYLLDFLEVSCRYPEETTQAILEYRNNNGGFRRSKELGLSTFEDTYFALAIFQKLGYLPQ